ncbi:MAG: ORF6C domain-containing protein [Lachnospiraceae bacterium]|nr:ORF6C domain-containing protein [Lachnospiraceae bacterium]
MNEMQIFQNEEFGQIRTIDVDGKIYFVANDAAKALGYKRPADAITTHCKGSVKRRYPTASGLQEVKVIPEGDLYRLITHSRMESAERFESWVFDEVIPSIRKAGSYGTPQLPQSPMELLELHYQAIKQVDGKVNLLSDNLEGVKKEFEIFKNDMPVLGIEESRITNAVRAQGVKCLGGKESNAYQNKSLRGKLYADIYHQLKRQFGISSYKAIKRNQCDTAVRIVEEYEPPMVLSETIENENAQMTIDME